MAENVTINGATITVDNGIAYPVRLGCKTLDNKSRLEASKYNHPASVAKRIGA
jgi:hypothetical protein